MIFDISGRGRGRGDGFRWRLSWELLKADVG